MSDLLDGVPLPELRALLRVVRDPKPIPDRRHDYDAWFDGYEEAHTATGATAEEAIDELAEYFELPWTSKDLHNYAG